MKIEFNVIINRAKVMRSNADVYEAVDKVAKGEMENAVFRCADEKESYRVNLAARRAAAMCGGLRVSKSATDVYVLKKVEEGAQE